MSMNFIGHRVKSFDPFNSCDLEGTVIAEEDKELTVRWEDGSESIILKSRVRSAH